MSHISQVTSMLPSLYSRSFQIPERRAIYPRAIDNRRSTHSAQQPPIKVWFSFHFYFTSNIYIHPPFSSFSFFSSSPSFLCSIRLKSLHIILTELPKKNTKHHPQCLIQSTISRTLFISFLPALSNWRPRPVSSLPLKSPSPFAWFSSDPPVLVCFILPHFPSQYFCRICQISANHIDLEKFHQYYTNIV